MARLSLLRETIRIILITKKVIEQNLKNDEVVENGKNKM